MNILPEVPNLLSKSCNLCWVVLTKGEAAVGHAVDILNILLKLTIELAPLLNFFLDLVRKVFLHLFYLCREPLKVLVGDPEANTQKAG